MAVKEFQGIFKPSKERHPVIPNGLAFHIKDNFTIQQFLLVGALGQILIVAILPIRYALLPAFILLLHTIITTTIQITDPSKNPRMQGVITKTKFSAQLPSASYDPRTGVSPYGSQPAREGIVVLHLGARFNHPLGIFGPGVKEVGSHFAKCNNALLTRAKEFGCIGYTNWRAAERPSQNTTLGVYYFRSIEGLNAFAHDPVHRAVWDWYSNFTKKLGFTHIGVYHETFYSAPGSYETVYLNMQPLLMGATNVQTVNEETGEEEWMRPVVDAGVPQLRSMMQRMNKVVREDDEAKKDLYL